MQLTAVEQLAYTTVRIETELEDGGVGTGTGFFYSLDPEGDEHIPVIFTNRHVVKSAKRGMLRLTLTDQNGNPDPSNHFVFQIDEFQRYWTPHPDPKVDLCAMPIAPLISEARQQGNRPFFFQFDKSLIPLQSEIDDLLGLEEIAMVGTEWNMG